MSFTHTITHGWSNGGGAITQAVAKTAGQEINIDENIAASQTDKAVALAIDVSQLKSLFILSDAAITLETNDGSAADDAITLAAGVPVVWQEGDAAACPLTTDVTGLFATTGAIGAGGANLQIRALVDPTV
jgi:hypothetical protein